MNANFSVSVQVCRSGCDHEKRAERREGELRDFKMQLLEQKSKIDVRTES